MSDQRRRCSVTQPGGRLHVKDQHRLRVLVIDDEADVRALWCEFLTALGHEPDQAANGSDGVRLFEHDPYDLVVTDLVMPGATGWEVATALRRRDPAVGVVIITGSATNLDRDRVRDAGLVLLQKPVNFQDFRAALELALSGARAPANGNGP